MEIENSKNYILTNLMFLMMAILFIGTSFALGFIDTPFKLMIAITQYGTILIPSILFLKFRGHNLKEALRLKKVSFKVLMMSLLITLLALPIAYTLNFIMTVILAQFDWLGYVNMPLGSGGVNYLIIIFLMSVTPGICEEVFFRGMILNGYEKVFTARKTIILTGLLFGLFHFNLQNLLLPAFLGMIFAWLVMTTGSIFTSMLGHAVFNAIGVSMSYTAKSTSKADFKESAEMLKDFPPEMITILGFMFVVSIFCGGLLFLCMSWLKRKCYQGKVGDSISIQGHVFEVLSITDMGIVVDHEGEERIISTNTLEATSYKFIEKKVIKERYKTPLMNYLLIALVMAIFIVLEIVPRIN